MRVPALQDPQAPHSTVWPSIRKARENIQTLLLRPTIC